VYACLEFERTCVISLANWRCIRQDSSYETNIQHKKMLQFPCKLKRHISHKVCDYHRFSFTCFPLCNQRSFSCLATACLLQVPGWLLLHILLEFVLILMLMPVVPTEVNISYQFLEKRAESFCQWLISRYIKGRLKKSSSGCVNFYKMWALSVHRHNKPFQNDLPLFWTKDDSHPIQPFLSG
jgi:hypothetical protein